MHNNQDLIVATGETISNTTKLELTKADLTRVVNAVVTNITQLAYNGGIRISGLGSFRMKRQAARKGNGFGTEWVSEEKDVLRFKAGRRKI